MRCASQARGAMSLTTDKTSAPLRICLLPPADLTSDSGSTLYTKAVVSGLAERGHQVSIVCSHSDPALDVEYIEAPIPLPHPYDDNQGTPSAVFYDCIDVTFRALLPRLEAGSWDVIHAIYPSFNGFTAALISGLFEAPCVISCLGRIVNVAAYLDRRYRALAAATFANSELLIAANQGVKDRIVQEYGFDAGRIEVLPMAVALPGFIGGAEPQRVARSAANGVVEILSVCSCITEEKGVADVLKALSLLQPLDPELRWRYTVVGPDPVAGEPYLAELIKYSKSLNLQDRVRFLGFVPHAQVVSYLRAADFLVDARRVGNFSSVILEALATGTAVICSDVEGNTEFVKHNENGLLFKSGDPESLARVLSQLLRSPEVIKRLEAAASDWFVTHGERYQIPAHVRRLEQVYDAAILARKRQLADY